MKAADDPVLGRIVGDAAFYAVMAPPSSFVRLPRIELRSEKRMRPSTTGGGECQQLVVIRRYVGKTPVEKRHHPRRDHESRNARPNLRFIYQFAFKEA